MLNGEFTRGTTPTHIFSLPCGVNMSDIVNISIAYRQKSRTVLIKKIADCFLLPELDPNKCFAVVLSQEETLLFNPKIPIVSVQLKGQTTGSDVIPLGEYRFRLKDCFDEEIFDLG